MFSLRFLSRWISEDVQGLFRDGLLALSILVLVDTGLIVLLCLKLGLVPVFLLLLVVKMLYYVALRLTEHKLSKRVIAGYSQGIFQPLLFLSLTGLGVSHLFLLGPGFISFLLGLLCLGPFRMRLGKKMARDWAIDWKDVYEYLKLDKY